MPRKTLTAVQVSTIKKPGFHRDPLTIGLYLQVARSKSGVSRVFGPIASTLRLPASCGGWAWVVPTCCHWQRRASSHRSIGEWFASSGATPSRSGTQRRQS